MNKLKDSGPKTLPWGIQDKSVSQKRFMPLRTFVPGSTVKIILFRAIYFIFICFKWAIHVICCSYDVVHFSLRLVIDLSKGTGAALQKHLPVVIPCLLDSLSETESAVLNYLAVRSTEDELEVVSCIQICRIWRPFANKRLRYLSLGTFLSNLLPFRA